MEDRNLFEQQTLEKTGYADCGEVDKRRARVLSLILQPHEPNVPIGQSRPIRERDAEHQKTTHSEERVAQAISREH